MPLLPDVNISSIYDEDSKKQLEKVVAQVNEWARLISNEDRVKIIKSDQTTEAIRIGELEDGSHGLSFSDGDTTFLTITKDGLILNDGVTDRILIGKDVGGF